MYADGILIFSKANPKSFRAIKSIFSELTCFSCLEISTTKKVGE